MRYSNAAHFFSKLIPRNSRLKIILKVEKTNTQTIKNLNYLTLNIYCAPSTYEGLTSGQEYPHELCSLDVPGLLFHLESVALISHRFLSIFLVWLLSSCVLSSGFQDPIPSPTSHSFLFRKKERRLISASGLQKHPQVLRVLGSISLARVVPRATLFCKWINKRRILSRNITFSNKIKVGLPIKRERKNITRGACSNQWETHWKKSKRITCNLFIGTNFFCPDTRLNGKMSCFPSLYPLESNICWPKLLFVPQECSWFLFLVTMCLFP